MLSEVQQRQLHCEHQVATALAVHVQKSLTQFAIDGGSWDVAQLLWPLLDIQEHIAFGGEEKEMRAAQRYRKALADLKPARKATETQGSEEDVPAKGAAKDRWKKKSGGGKGQPEPAADGGRK